MILAPVVELLKNVQFAELVSLDAMTVPSVGYRKLTTNELVLIFNNLDSSGYERLVKQRLGELGKDPNAFQVSYLPWGERMGNSPVIYHKGEHYLQTIVVKPGKMTAYIGETELQPDEIPSFFYMMDEMKATARRQGLPVNLAVIVRTYKLANLIEMRMQDKTYK